MVRRLARSVWRVIYARYLFASVIALSADLASFLALLRAGLSPVTASMLGYMLGLAVHWLLSTRLVFTVSRTRGRERHQQKLLFLVSALAGLAITAGIVGAGHMMGFDPRIAKMGAVAVSFQVTYLLRRSVVFA